MEQGKEARGGLFLVSRAFSHRLDTWSVLLHSTVIKCFDSPLRSPSRTQTPSQPGWAVAQTCCFHTYTVGGAAGQKQQRVNWWQPYERNTRTMNGDGRARAFLGKRTITAVCTAPIARMQGRTQVVQKISRDWVGICGGYICREAIVPFWLWWRRLWLEKWSKDNFSPILKA